MLDNLESNYDCAASGEDLHALLSELSELRGRGSDVDALSVDRINRLENQISFIKNKCDIRP
ncbi:MULTISPECIES: DUF2524 domain-containing protein [Paenibacillus]|uniref:DUF2524 domain-containing protein n=1 Tax=Paenibacillus TaxID=44249 RepID=UPI0022B8CBD3|nr:DUF2524 domain-containing protein [Paenibacillus caseinilyticus]MCZ8520626.1 DUF2524 domain-containing protein [Paenibacillus caseinilyticus]